ncbi:RING finger protein nhl-1-like [Bolinopsis microptera]|uniref:RING finger protein nhl-1-like n=1 Tax=Bolinopsis microptera TaxID=2820187 RepID=UPI00307A5095
MVMGRVATTGNHGNHLATARERIEDEVTCPVCMDRFTVTGDHVPRILPCHHTVCHMCLMGISRADNQQVTFYLKCPSCRNQAEVPNGEIINFEVDFRVNRLIEVLSRLQHHDNPGLPADTVWAKAALFRPEVNKSANALRSFLRQLELAIRQNDVNTLLHKKKVADSIKLCMALLKQKEKEMLDEMESRRVKNEEALVLQQEEAVMELENMESVLALQRSCFSHCQTEELIAVEAEVLPLLEVYSKRHLVIRKPLLPETLTSFTQELSEMRKAVTERMGGYVEKSGSLHSSSSTCSAAHSSNTCSAAHSSSTCSAAHSSSTCSAAHSSSTCSAAHSNSSLNDSGISDTPPTQTIAQESNSSTQDTAPVSRDQDTALVSRDHLVTTPSVRRPLQNSLTHFSSSWGSQGSGPGHLDTPTGLCIINQTQIAVADAGNCRICIFDSNGHLVNLFGRRGRLTGQLNCPNAVASRGDRIFVADTYNHRISVHRLDGSFLSSFGSKGGMLGEFDRPIGITTTESEEVIVADTWNHRLQVFDLEGNFIRHIGKRGTGAGQFQCPCGVAVDSRGQIYVCDLDNKRIQVLDSWGRYLRHFGAPGTHPGALHAPRAIAIDNNDYVYITEYEKHYFQVFDSQDDFVSRYGSHGNGPGQFDKPCGVSVDTCGKVIISDSFNHRLHIF